MAFPAIFFCFEDNPNDKPDAPNKIYLDKEAPTLQDFAAALKSVFKIGDQLSFRLGDDPNIYADDSPVPAPINDRSRIVFVRVGAPQEPVEPGDIEPWLQKEGVDPDVIRIMKDNRVNVATLKTLTDEGLSKMGVGHWVARTQVLDAIKKYDTASTLVSPQAGLLEKRKHEDIMGEVAEVTGESPANKRFKMGRNKQIKIKIKDVDVLVHCEKMPIKMGMTVYTGSATNNPVGHVIGTIVQHRDKAAIEYVVNGETRYGNISKFYRDVTGDALQEKGNSWSNIFFKDNDGQVYTLESLKYIIYGPKRPVSAFLYFSNEARIKHKELKPDAFARLAGELWRKLDNADKEPYRVLEDQDKARFTRERQEWEALLAKYSVQHANANAVAHAQHQQHAPPPPPHVQHPQQHPQLTHTPQQHPQHPQHQLTQHPHQPHPLAQHPQAHPQHSQHPQHTPHAQHPQHAQHATHAQHPQHASQMQPPQSQPPHAQQPPQHLVPHETMQQAVHHDQLMEAPVG